MGLWQILLCNSLAVLGRRFSWCRSLFPAGCDGCGQCSVLPQAGCCLLMAQDTFQHVCESLLGNFISLEVGLPHLRGGVGDQVCWPHWSPTLKAGNPQMETTNHKEHVKGERSWGLLDASTLAAFFTLLGQRAWSQGSTQWCSARSLYHSLTSLHTVILVTRGMKLAALNKATFCWARCESLEMPLLWF